MWLEPGMICRGIIVAINLVASLENNILETGEEEMRPNWQSFIGVCVVLFFGVLLAGCTPETITLETASAFPSPAPNVVMYGATDGSNVWIYHPGRTNDTVIYCTNQTEGPYPTCYEISPQ